MRRAIIPGLAMAAMTGLSLAQTPPAGRAPQGGRGAAPPAAAPANPPGQVPNIERGRRIVQAGTPKGAVACSQCHGLDGIGNPQSGFPHVNGQPAYYLYKQLNDYASGARQNPVMAPIAQALTDAERQDVAAYYASLGPAASAPAPPAPSRQAMETGRMLVAHGSAERGIQACVNCHGPQATGMGPVFPRLAGQYAEYARAQFAAFRDGTRRNDPEAVMREVARRMSDDEVAAVSSYLAALRPVPER